MTTLRPSPDPQSAFQTAQAGARFVFDILGRDLSHGDALIKVYSVRKVAHGIFLLDQDNHPGLLEEVFNYLLDNLLVDIPVMNVALMENDVKYLLQNKIKYVLPPESESNQLFVFMLYHLMMYQPSLKSELQTRGLLL